VIIHICVIYWWADMIVYCNADYYIDSDLDNKIELSRSIWWRWTWKQ